MRKLVKHVTDVVRGFYSIAVGMKTLMKYVDIRIKK